MDRHIEYFLSHESKMFLRNTGWNAKLRHRLNVFFYEYSVYAIFERDRWHCDRIIHYWKDNVWQASDLGINKYGTISYNECCKHIQLLRSSAGKGITRDL